MKKRPPPPDQIDMFPVAKAAKKEAMERVAENSGEWMPRAFARGMLVIEEHRNQLKTGEQLRFMIAPKVGEPHHHNAWGPLINEFVRHGVLTPTDKWVPMEGPKSNARATRLYRLTPNL